MKRYAFLYTIIASTALSYSMGPSTPNPAKEIIRAKGLEGGMKHMMQIVLPKIPTARPDYVNGAVIIAKEALIFFSEEEQVWLAASQRTDAERTWYTESKKTIGAFLEEHNTELSVQEEGAAARNDWVSRIMATEAFRQAKAVASTANGPQSSGSEAAQAGYAVSLPELLQALAEARQQHDALQQEGSDSATALEELENRMAALIEDQRQLGTVSAKSPQLAGSLSILIASLASDAENASAEAKARKNALREVQRRQQELAAQMSGTVSAANAHYNNTAAERSEIERRLQDLTFEMEKLRKNHTDSTRRLEQLGQARDLAAMLAQEGSLVRVGTQPTDD